MAAEAVRVVVRVRPPLGPAEARAPRGRLEVDPGGGGVALVRGGGGGGGGGGPGLRREFRFDRVLGGEASQADAYEAAGVGGLVAAALGGCHATVFAYGQTGSGKTHTMEGYQYRLDARGAPAPDFGTDPGALGIVPRAVRELFERARARHGERCLIECSHVQIYMEQAYDLLDPRTLPPERGASAGGGEGPAERRGPGERGRGGGPGLRMRWAKGRDFHLEGLTRAACASADEALAHFQKGVRNKVMASHRMNLSSSRSHSLFTLEVRAPSPEDPEEVVRSKFTLVDLAGSERSAHTGQGSGAGLQESIFINKSLFTLRKVITALAVDRASKFVPYRDSKLTSLLKNSLGGSAVTVMIACLSPGDAHSDENLSSLEYASRAKHITNRVVVNEDAKTRLIRELRAALVELKGRLAAAGLPSEPSKRPPGSAPPARGHVPGGPGGGGSGTGGGGGALRRAAPPAPPAPEAPGAPGAPGASVACEPGGDLAPQLREAQDAQETLLAENADLREQLSLIQAVVTMDDGAAGAGRGAEMHTANTAVLLELLELRRENESLQKQLAVVEAGKLQQKATKKQKALKNLSGRRRAPERGRPATAPRAATGKLTVSDLKNVLSQAGPSSAGATLRLSTTGKVLPGALERAAAPGGAAGQEAGGAARSWEGEVNDHEDPIAQLNRLMASRSALTRGQAG